MNKLPSEIRTNRLILLQCLSKERDVVVYNVFRCDESVGVLTLYFDTAEQLTEPDIEIAEPFRRNGYALEATDAVINAIVTAYPKYELVAQVPAEDVAANHLCRRLDFVLDRFDKLCNDNIYTM